MRAFAFTASQRSGGATPTPTPAPSFTPMPTPTADMLPAPSMAGASWIGVWSNARLMSGYAGALAYDGTDLGTGSPQVTTAEAAARRGSADAVRLGGWYDQTGGGKFLVTASGPTDTAAPAMREDVLIGAAPAMVFDGIRAGDPRTAQARRVQASVALNAQDMTLVYVLDPTVSTQEQCYFDLQIANDATSILSHIQYPNNAAATYGLPQINGNVRLQGPANGSGSRKVATVPQVVLIRATATGVDLFLDGVKTDTFGPLAANTSATLYFGGFAGNGIAAFNATFRTAMVGALNKAVNDADVAAITAALMGRFGIPTTYDATVVNIGSSRVTGMTYSTVARNKAWFERGRYNNRRVRTYNLAHDGKTQAACYSSRAVYDAEVFSYAPTKPTVFMLDDAINDLGNIGSIDGSGSSFDPNAIYATYTSYVTALHGLGSTAKVVIPTTMPQSSGTYAGFNRTDAAIDADRVTLNNLIRANGASADATSDPASDAAMGGFGTSTADTTKYGDRLHETSAGYALLAPYNPPATLGLLP